MNHAYKSLQQSVSEALYDVKETMPDASYKKIYDSLTKHIHAPLTDDEEALMEYKIEQFDQLFPNLPFRANLDDLDRLDNTFKDSKNLTIFHPNRCYCCCPEEDGGQIININRDRNITYRDIYTECERQWTEEMCNHIFLDHILETGSGLVILSFSS